MVDTTRVFSILNNEDIAERCKLAHDEIQPKLKEIINKFISNYSHEDDSINKFSMATHESELKKGYNDSSNNQEIDMNLGTFTYTGLKGKHYSWGIEIRCIGETRSISVASRIDTNDLIILYKKKELKNYIATLNKEFVFYKNDDTTPENVHEKLYDEVEYCRKKRKTPIFRIGREIKFEESVSEDYIVEQIWETWSDLSEFREFMINEGEKRDKARNIIDSFMEKNMETSIRLFNNEFKLVVKEKVTKKRDIFAQEFQVFDNGQLITKGNIDYYYGDIGYSPYEHIAISIKGNNQIYYDLRNLLEPKGKVEWKTKKRFAKKNRDNAELLRRAVEYLKDNRIDVEGSTYKVCNFDNVTEEFDQPINDIKAKLCKIGLLFADACEVIKVPKSSINEEESNEEHEEYENDIDEKYYSSSFDLEQIFEIIKSSDYTFSKDIIRDFHLNLTCLSEKHFVILNGISGTGKTKLCRLYANAVYGLNYKDENPYLRVIPVRPDWIDSTALFGYYSSIEKRYMRTEFIDTLLKAKDEPEKPFFVVLDEMNLARVEYYLSDYLSAIESGEAVTLNGVVEGSELPKQIEIPPNLYVIGTINVDETTHTISDKVLDRAFVMTLSDVDLKGFWEKCDLNNKEELTKEFKLLNEIYNKLLDYDLHFGYRTINEMMMKMDANLKFPKELQMSRMGVLDRVISEKVLPKVRGDERINDLLQNLINWTSTTLGDKSETLRHLNRMKGELERYGAAQFWR